MATYLVSYDLIGPTRDYDKIAKHLKSYGTWCRVLESVWLIVSDKTPVAIRDAAFAHMDANDRIIVVGTSPSDWASRVATDHSDWLHKFL